MATTYEECKTMINVCKENDVKLFVAYYRRELDYFKKIKDIIENKIIGNIKFVDIKLLFPPQKEDYDKNNLPWRVNPKISGAGYFYDLASHQFDFLDYLFGPIKSVKGHSANQLNLYEAEDIVSASYLFEENIIGNGTWCFSMENYSQYEKTEIIGSKGKITFSFFQPNPIKLRIEEEVKEISIDYPKHVQQQLIDTVVKDILGKSNCVSTGNTAARTNWVLEQIISQ